jgi:glycosyltransferase involved in cell wall biosynthesis
MTGSALRIGLVVPRFAPYHGGAETWAAQHAAALAANGAEVTVVTQVPRGARLLPRDVHDGYTIERHYLPFGEIFDVPSLAAARAACRSRRFDVVWVHNHHTPLAWLAVEQAKAPLVFTPHYHGVGHTPLRQALQRVYRPAGRRLMAASRRIVMDTDAEAGLVLRDFPGQVQRRKISVVPPAVAESGADVAHTRASCQSC